LPWKPLLVGFIGFYPQNWDRLPSVDGGAKEVQVLRWTQTNQLTGSMDAGDSVN